LTHSTLIAAALALATLITSQNCLAEPEPSEDLSGALVSYAKLEYQAAFRMLVPLADHGNAVAQEILGFMYSRGEGVSRDDARAFAWFKLAAEAGRPDAQFEVGKMYRNGAGTQPDADAALFWLRRAADQGKVEALEALAEQYWGQGAFPADATAALELSLDAAKHGSAIAMYNIGLLYAEGRYVGWDEIEALKWFDLAYNQAIGRFREDVVRARSAMAERLMPMQVQVALSRSRDWWLTHIEKLPRAKRCHPE
jgi:TPR repeat protein